MTRIAILLGVVGVAVTQPTPWPGINGPVVLNTPAPPPPPAENITIWFQNGVVSNMQGGTVAAQNRMVQAAEGVTFSCTQVCGTDTDGVWRCAACIATGSAVETSISNSTFYTVGYETQSQNTTTQAAMLTSITGISSELSAIFQATFVNVSIDPVATPAPSDDDFPITNTLWVGIGVLACIIIFGCVALVLMCITPSGSPEVEEELEIDKVK
eukprot:TRINITY_DN529_c3_g2_i1.p1 TRINITY_DN529_c3_g2~~TRINITY_DN529_c3_g2_i1.p1  ORF type:complete len:220 (+),score=33.42 TRINITY_DN529_c3_g2_i1:23-661(+)